MIKGGDIGCESTDNRLGSMLRQELSCSKRTIYSENEKRMHYCKTYYVKISWMILSCAWNMTNILSCDINYEIKSKKYVVIYAFGRWTIIQRLGIT